MIKVIGNDLMRGGKKIGWVTSDHVLNHEGRKICYFNGHKIYDMDMHVMGYIDGNYLKTPGTFGRGIRLDDMSEFITGGSLSTLGRAAVRLSLGD